MLGFFCFNAPITCSLNGCWNVEPDPFSVAEPPCAGALAPATATPDVARPATSATGTSHRRLARMRFIELCPPWEFQGGTLRSEAGAAVAARLPTGEHCRND